MLRLPDFFTRSIRRKVLTSYGSVLVLVLVMGVVGYYQLDQVRDWSAHFLPKSRQMELAQDFALLISSLDANLERFFVTGGKQVREDLARDLDAVVESVEALQENADGEALPVSVALEGATGELTSEIRALLGTEPAEVSSQALNREIVSIYQQIDRVEQLQEALIQETLGQLRATVQRQQRVVSSVVNQFLVGGTLIFVFVAIASYWLSRVISAPIAKLRNASIDVGAGRLDTQISVPSNDELGQLALSFNRMVENIQRAEAALRESEARYRELNAELERRVVARTAELRAVNKELEAFAYSVSHDLRAPLRSINGFSQALLEDYGDALDDAGHDYLRRVRAASQRMAQLIDDLLTLSRVTRREMRRTRVDLSALARRIDAEHRQRAPERQVTFVAQPGVVAQGDEPLLQVMLENLLDNAWKFTGQRKRARIEFGVSDGGRQAVYYVRDDGAGFDMAYADKLFQPFQRLHRETDFEGTGIGLATVQRIVRRHGGRIWAEAEVDRGATFFFTLSAATTRV